MANAAAEWEETRLKARAVLQALNAVESESTTLGPMPIDAPAQNTPSGSSSPRRASVRTNWSTSPFRRPGLHGLVARRPRRAFPPERAACGPRAPRRFCRGPRFRGAHRRRARFASDIPPHRRPDPDGSRAGRRAGGGSPGGPIWLVRHPSRYWRSPPHRPPRRRPTRNAASPLDPREPSGCLVGHVALDRRAGLCHRPSFPRLEPKGLEAMDGPAGAPVAGGRQQSRSGIPAEPHPPGIAAAVGRPPPRMGGGDGQARQHHGRMVQQHRPHPRWPDRPH